MHYFMYKYMFKKRAQGLSITTIIVAILALIVIVVIVAMLTGKFGLFGAGAERALSCESFCNSFGWENSEVKEEKRCAEPHQIVKSASDVEKGKICCCTTPLT